MKSKVAVVTGAGRGIGAAIAKALAGEKLAVACLDLDGAAARRIADEIVKAKGRAVGIECDVGDRKSVEAALAKIAKGLGEPCVLVNNAGYGGPFHRVDEVSDDEWERVMATNLKSVFFFARALLPKMRAAGFGRIVNIASIQGLYGSARSSTYVASKHAMIGYTRAIAAEWGEHGITCNAICPGYVQTAMGVQEDKVDDYLRKVVEKTPVKRVAAPEEIASMVVQLVGAQSGYVNGAAIVMDGGISAHVGIT